MTRPDTGALANLLQSVGAYRLLCGLGGEDTDAVWAEAGEGALRALALDEGQNVEPRFLAAELLAERSPSWVPARKKALVARLYVEGLRAQVGGANRWGLPGEVGPAAQHLLKLGKAGRDALVPVLEDTTLVQYAGSREVQAGRRIKWRLKDVAATLLSADGGALATASVRQRDELASQLAGSGA